MPGKAIEIDVTELSAFFQKMGKAGGGDFKKEMQKFLIGIGDEFLRIVQDEIIRRKVVDTRLLLHSFSKGDGNNVWKLSSGNLTLEVGTNVQYASYVNDGHWTNPKGVATRWVPGVWNGSHFEYSPGAKTGMLLKQHWVTGKHYWEGAIRILEKMFPQLMEAKLQQWINNYFS